MKKKDLVVTFYGMKLPSKILYFGENNRYGVEVKDKFLVLSQIHYKSDWYIGFVIPESFSLPGFGELRSGIENYCKYLNITFTDPELMKI